MRKKAFIIESEEFDSPIVVKKFEDIKEAIQCMYGEIDIDNFPDGEVLSIGIKSFYEKELEDILSNEWQG